MLFTVVMFIFLNLHELVWKAKEILQKFYLIGFRFHDNKEFH